MSSTFDVIQGAVRPLTYKLKPEADMTNWSVRVQVREDYSAPAVFDLVLSLAGDTLSRSGLLDTTGIEPGNYILAAEFTNGVSGESDEVHDTLVIHPQAVYDD